MSAWIWTGLFILSLMAVAILLVLAQSVRVANRNIEEMRFLRDREASRRVEWMLREGFPVRRIVRELQVPSHAVNGIRERMKREGVRR